jgi:aspartyl-tRNA(Asn)/glutamyl-tRNA(Gln) amidotransferase subunit C
LADLAGLSLSEAEVRARAHDLSQIVEYISHLKELDTKNVEPTYQVTGLESVWREDEIQTHLSREELLDLAGDHVRENCVEVPKVL